MSKQDIGNLEQLYVNNLNPNQEQRMQRNKWIYYQLICTTIDKKEE